MTLEMKVIGMDTLKKGMTTAQNTLRNRRKANARAVTLMDRWVQLNFKTKGHNVGGWKSLADATKTKKRGGESAVPLQDTGDLKRKWQHIATDKTAILRSAVDYGVPHDQGGRNNRPPQRRILPDEKEAFNIVKPAYQALMKLAIKNFKRVVS